MLLPRWSAGRYPLDTGGDNELGAPAAQLDLVRFLDEREAPA